MQHLHASCCHRKLVPACGMWRLPDSVTQNSNPFSCTSVKMLRQTARINAIFTARCCTCTVTCPPPNFCQLIILGSDQGHPPPPPPNLCHPLCPHRLPPHPNKPCPCLHSHSCTAVSLPPSCHASVGTNFSQPRRSATGKTVQPASMVSLSPAENEDYKAIPVTTFQGKAADSEGSAQVLVVYHYYESLTTCEEDEEVQVIRSNLLSFLR